MNYNFFNKKQAPGPVSKNTFVQNPNLASPISQTNGLQIPSNVQMNTPSFNFTPLSNTSLSGNGFGVSPFGGENTPDLSIPNYQFGATSVPSTVEGGNQITASDTVNSNGTTNPIIPRDTLQLPNTQFNAFGKVVSFDGNNYYLPSMDLNSNIPYEKMQEMAKTAHETNMDIGSQFGLYNLASQGVDTKNTSDVQGEEGEKGKYGLDLFGHTSYSLESALFGLGNALGRKDWSDNPDVARQEKFANTLSGIGNAGKLLVGGARVFTSGKGYGKKNSWVYNNMKEKMRDNLVHNQNGVTTHNQAGVNNAQIGTERTYEDGGEHRDTGGVNIARLGYDYVGRHNRRDDRGLIPRKTMYEYIDTSGPVINEALAEFEPVKRYAPRAESDPNDPTHAIARNLAEMSDEDLNRVATAIQNNANSQTNAPKQSTTSTISNGKSKVVVKEEQPKIYMEDDVVFIGDEKPNYLEMVRYNNSSNNSEAERLGLSHKNAMLRSIKLGDGKSSNPAINVNGRIFGSAKEAFKYLNEVSPNLERSDFASKLESLGLKNIPEFAEGGEYGGQEELIAQLQQAVEAGEITPEQAEQYLAEMQGGGQQAPAQGGSQEDIVAQLQQAVDSGQMTPEEAQAYLEQMQQQGGQGQAPQGSQEDIVAQLQQAVQNGEMTPEEAEQYLAQMQQQGGGESAQSDVQQQPQMSPEEAKQQLEMMVQNGEISPEEAQTYLQQMFGATPTTEPTVPYTQDMAGKLTPEQYMTGEYTTGSENRPYNAEVEAGEYINKDGLTQKVVGNKHSRGGEKMNLEDGTIVISDKGRIGNANARALSIQTGMKLKAGDTFAQVLDIYTKRIGLDKLNKEQEDLFKQLKKVQGKGSQTTQDLNNDFLNMKIQETEEKKQQLLQMREQMVQVLFEMQENAKQPDIKQDGEVPKYAEGTVVGGEPNQVIPNAYDPYQANILVQGRSVLGGSGNGIHNPGSADYMKQFIEGIRSWEALNGDYAALRARGEEAFGKSKSDLDRFNVANRWLQRDRQNLNRKYIGEAALAYSGMGHAPVQKALQYVYDTNSPEQNKKYLKALQESGIKVVNGKIVPGGFYKTNAYYNKDNSLKKYFDEMGVSDPDRYRKVGVTNVTDGVWDRRYETLHQLEFDTEEERDNYFKQKEFVKFKTNDGGDIWVDPYHRNNFIVSKIKGKPQPEPEPEPEPTPEPEPEKKPLQLPKKIGNHGPVMLPDQSVLPPEALRDAPKHDIRLNYLDRVQASPEELMKQNYRAMNEARAKLEGLPDNMAAANLAQLIGNTAAANVQATQQTNAQNAQSDLAVRTHNLNTLAQQQQLDYRLDDQYDERMNKAIDTTRKDLEGYFDFNRKVHVGDFNTRSQLNLLNNLYSKYGINSDGSIGFQPISDSLFTTSDGQAFTSQQKAIEHEMALRNKKVQSQKKEETPKQEEVTPSKKK